MQFVSVVLMIVQSALYPLGAFLAGTALFNLWFHCLAKRAKRRERVDLTGLTPTTARPYRHLYAPVCTPPF